MDILGAVNEFIMKYAPGVEQVQLYRGYQNRMALPSKQDYIVMSLGTTARIGTNVSDYDRSSDELYTTKTLREYTINVDFCSIYQEVAQRRAIVLEVISNGNIAVDFFKQYGLSYNYAEDVQYIPFISEQDQYVHRYRINLHLTKWDKVTIPQQYAERVELSRIENIDAHHKP